MAEYFIDEKGTNEWKVSKVEELGTVKSEYTVTQDDMGLLCNCPRWMKRRTTSCRHTEMVTEWIHLGRPIPYFKEL